jgi:hypothetical protein
LYPFNINPMQVAYMGRVNSSIWPDARCSFGKPMRASSPVTYSASWIRCLSCDH